MENIKHKFLPKVANERDLNVGEIIYLDISSQNKPSRGGSNHWILFKDPDIWQKWSFFMKKKEELTVKVTPFLKKLNNMREKVKIICCDNAGKNRYLEENCVNNNCD